VVGKWQRTTAAVHEFRRARHDRSQRRSCWIGNSIGGINVHFNQTSACTGRNCAWHLIEQLNLPDVRLVAQSMGGWTSLEYVLAHPNHKVRALVLASTCGTVHKPSIPLADPHRLTEWNQKAAAARADMARRGISPPCGERMAREQSELHLLYRMIANASAAFDREELRKHLYDMATRPPDVLRSVSIPTLFFTGGEDTSYPPFLSDALATLMSNAKVEQVPDSRHSVYFQRAGIFNRLVEDFLSKVG
jgi:pimeloyl-ACP methyl ester carboxylesterase